MIHTFEAHSRTAAVTRSNHRCYFWSYGLTCGKLQLEAAAMRQLLAQQKGE